MVILSLLFYSCNNNEAIVDSQKKVSISTPHINNTAKHSIRNVKKIVFEYKKISHTRNISHSKIENIVFSISNTWKNRSIRDSLLSVDDSISIPRYEKDMIYFDKQLFLIDSILKINIKDTFLPIVVDCYYFEFKNSRFIVLYLINQMYNHSAFSKSILLLFDITKQNDCKLVRTIDFYQQMTDNEPYRFGDFDGDGKLDMINWTFEKKDTVVIQSILKK